MRTRKLGNTGVATPAIGLGCMEMSPVYSAADDAMSIAVIHTRDPEPMMGALNG